MTGSGRLFATLDHYLVTSQISSFATAFVTVFAVIFLIFRSWRFGVLAIVPNLFPVLAVFGVMGWLDISLNVATVMLASVALGVVDDDTIHFISRYRKETAQGAGTREAIATATAHEGRAALTTAVINSCAFGVLALSEYRPTAWFGGLLALTMVVAFLAEIFVLPATITLAPRLFGADRVHRSRRRSQRDARWRMTSWAIAVAVAVLSQAAAGGAAAAPALKRRRRPRRPSHASQIGGDISLRCRRAAANGRRRVEAAGVARRRRFGCPGSGAPGSRDLRKRWWPSAAAAASRPVCCGRAKRGLKWPDRAATFASATAGWCGDDSTRFSRPM